MLNIAFGQSKYFVDNLSENVKRGHRQKVRRGEYPGVAPTGYLNDRVKHVMVRDPERFRLVQKAFEWYGAGDYSLKDLRQKLIKVGLVSRKGKPLVMSNLQRLLTNPFYYGYFEFNGELHEGKHEPAVSKQLFDRVQRVLADRSRPQKRSEKLFPFRGLLKCGECGRAITSEIKRGHTYYRCTKKDTNCSQRYAREESLASQSEEMIKKVALPAAWAEPMLAKCDEASAESAQADATFVNSLKLQIVAIEEKLELLLDARIEGVVTNDEYVAKKNKLLNQKIDLEQGVKERKSAGWLEQMRAFILEAHQAPEFALAENLQTKTNFLKTVGSNATLRDRTLHLTFNSPWSILAKYDMGSLRDTDLIPNFGKTEFWLAEMVSTVVAAK